MRPDVKLGVAISLVVVVVAGGYYIYRDSRSTTIPLSSTALTSGAQGQGNPTANELPKKSTKPSTLADKKAKPGQKQPRPAAKGTGARVAANDRKVQPRGQKPASKPGSNRRADRTRRIAGSGQPKVSPKTGASRNDRTADGRSGTAASNKSTQPTAAGRTGSASAIQPKRPARSTKGDRESKVASAAGRFGFGRPYGAHSG